MFLLLVTQFQGIKTNLRNYQGGRVVKQGDIDAAKLKNYPVYNRSAIKGFYEEKKSRESKAQLH